jgi:protein arginine kinase
VITGIKMETLNDLILFIQPAYLQKLAGRPLSPDERDLRRAELIRSRLRME